MENVSINWARDLPASARTAIEKLLGRSLRDDEEVSIMALHSHPAPSGEARRASAEGLKGALDQLAHKAKRVADEEFDAAVDEAMNHIPPGGHENSSRYKYARASGSNFSSRLVSSPTGDEIGRFPTLDTLSTAKVP
jgi:hypothetical protein